MLNRIDCPKVFYQKNGYWKACFVIDGIVREFEISEYNAMILAESILTAAKRKADPDPVERAA